jgi:hypothetical protein
MNNDKLLERINYCNSAIESYQQELNDITFENQQEDVQKANLLMEKIDKVIEELEQLISDIE